MPFDKFEPIEDNWKFDKKEKVKPPCNSSEHNPPSMMVYKPGHYIWRCPKCGKTTEFNVPLVTLNSLPPIEKVLEENGIW